MKMWKKLQRRRRRQRQTNWIRKAHLNLSLRWAKKRLINGLELGRYLVEKCGNDSSGYRLSSHALNNNNILSGCLYKHTYLCVSIAQMTLIIERYIIGKKKSTRSVNLHTLVLAFPKYVLLSVSRWSLNLNGKRSFHEYSFKIGYKYKLLKKNK